MSSPASAAAPGWRVLADAGLALHTSHAQPHSRDNLDLTTLVGTPEPCSTLGQMLARYPVHRLPLGLMSVDSAWKKAQQVQLARDGTPPDLMQEHLAKRLVALNSLYRLGYRYIAPTIRSLVQEVWPRLPSADRILATLVLPDRPVHYYADLDGTFAWALEPQAADKCRAEFLTEFAAYFKAYFQRDADLSGAHWERAVRDGKLSLHVHITSEAFASVRHLRAFDRGFQRALRERSQETLAVSYLCRRSADEEGAFECLLDASVYHDNSLLRLCGNRKPPEGPLLEHWPMSDEPARTEEELLWRGMPNLSLPVAPYLECHDEAAAARRPGIKRSHRGEAVAPDAAAYALDSVGGRALQQLLTEHLGPNVRIRDCCMVAKDHLKGGCEPQTAWCVHRGSPYVHGDNRMLFSCTPRTLLLHCPHPACTAHKKRVSLTPDQTKQLFGVVPPPVEPLRLEPSAQLRACMADGVLTEVDAKDLVADATVLAFAAEHMHAHKRVVYLDSQMGTAKTKLMLRELAARARAHPQAWRQDRREATLILSVRRLFAASLGAQLQQYGEEHHVLFDFLDYTRPGVTDEHLRTHQRIILSLESLLRLVDQGGALPRFGCIILDEVEELLAILSSSTLHGKRRQALRVLVGLLQQADRVWVADADLEAHTGVRFLLEQLPKTDGWSHAYLFNRCQTLTRQYVFAPSEAAMAQEMLRALQARLNIWVACNSKAPVDRIYAWLRLKLHGVRLQLREDADVEEEADTELKLMTGDSSADEKRELMTDPAVWRVRALLVSPVVGPGISFEQAWYHRAFLLVGRRTTSDRQAFQQLNRVRNLADPRVWVYVTPATAAGQQHEQQLRLELDDDAAVLQRNLQRTRAHVSDQWRRYSEVHGDALDPGWEPRSDDGAPHQLTLADTGYNAVFLRNVLQVLSARQWMTELLQWRMRLAGGTVSDVPECEGVKQVAHELRRCGQECQALRAQRVADADLVNRVDDVFAKEYATIRATYGLPAHMELTDSFVVHMGTPVALSKFEELRMAVCGGSFYLDTIVMQQRQVEDYAHHCLQMRDRLRLAEQHLAQLGFRCWADFFRGVEVEVPEAHKALIVPARSFLRGTLGVGLVRPASKLRNGQRFHRVSVDLFPGRSAAASDDPLYDRIHAQLLAVVQHPWSTTTRPWQ